MTGPSYMLSTLLLRIKVGGGEARALSPSPASALSERRRVESTPEIARRSNFSLTQ